jgi:hypothetical protein
VDTRERAFFAAEDAKAERVDWVYIDENWGENVDGKRREKRRRMIRWERGVRELARKQTHVRCGRFPKSSLLIAVYSEGKSSQRGHFPPRAQRICVWRTQKGDISVVNLLGRGTLAEILVTISCA